MTGTEWLVILAGGGLIVLVNWWFFLAGGTAAVAREAGGRQLATIVVDGGYQPATVRLRSGRPTRLLFDRRDEGSCSEEVVIPDLGVRRFLPAHATTEVDLPAVQPGRYEFTCGMRMLRGRLEVTEEGGDG